MEKTWNAHLDKTLSEMVGKKTKQACPECGAVMVIRQNKYDRTFFLGCHAYPACKQTMEIPETLRLELLGFKPLPRMLP